MDKLSDSDNVEDKLRWQSQPTILIFNAIKSMLNVR